MTGADNIPQCIIDPELLIPDEGYETELDFWDRMNLIRDYEKYLAFGPYTRASFDDFSNRCFDELFSTLNSIVSEPDIFTLYGELNKLPDYHESAEGQPVKLDKNQYVPVYGPEDNRFVMQCDLSETTAQHVLTDASVWDRRSVGTSSRLNKVIMVDVSQSVSEYARSIIMQSPSFELIHDLASEAFPKLEFCDETWKTTKCFKGDKRENARKMADCFTKLNDFALGIWREWDEKGEREDRLGFNCSPENGGTTSNNKCMNERTYLFNGETITMSWHAKFEGHRNRFYFEVDTDNDRVIIGGCTEHYST